MERRPAQEYQNYAIGHSVGHRSQFVGEVRSVQDGWVEVETKNKFSVGDTIEIIHPSGNRKVPLTTMKNTKGEAIEMAPGSLLRVWIPTEGPADGALIARMF